MRDDIKISIIIPVFNQCNYTKNCINFIEKNTYHDSDYLYEIIVVDNNSTDSTNEIVNELSKGKEYIRYLKLDNNFGFAYACNYGAKHSKGEYLVFLNNDTEPQKDWLKYGIDRLKYDESIGIVGIKLLYPDNTIQHCGIDFFENVNPNYLYWPLHRYLKADNNLDYVNRPEEVVGVTGACLFISKRIFETVNGFDENYGMYFEDLDLCFKVRSLGYKIFYEPKSVVIHYEGKSSPNRDVIDELNKNAAKLFFSKWDREVKFYILSRYFEYHDKKFTIIKKDIYPKSLLGNNFSGNIEYSTKEYITFIELINSIGEAYVHFGGAGDALLLLSTFYDEAPEQIIISFANSTKALKSFFEAFPLLKHVYIIPLPPNYVLHTSLRKILPKLKNIKGMGATPLDSYDKEWNENLNIFKKYGIQKRPLWINNFKGNKEFPYQVTIAPKGSLMGMVGSKKNIISYNDWLKTIKFFNKRGIKLIILGTPEEKAEYPNIQGNIDKRSYSFKEQMELIANSDIFIGADSWGKTFAALAGIKTFVFKPLRGNDLKNWIDASEYVFIKPWKEITLIENFNELKKHLLKIPILNRNFTIAIDGPIKSMNSLALVNAELSLQFIKHGYNISLISHYEIEKDFFNDTRFNILKQYVKKSNKSDVVISHYFPPRPIKPSSKKWIIIQPWEFGSIPKDWIYLFNELADEIWVPSNFVRNIFCNDGVKSSKVQVIPNGVDGSVFNKNEKRYKLKTKKKLKLLFIGGTIYRKGIDILLKAYTSAFTANDDVCLIIKDVGINTVYAGRNYSEQINQISSLPNVAEIEYINKNLSNEELVALYNTCDFLVHPYRGEGFALPVLEAMACGLIPIVTKNGATDDYCNDENSIRINSSIKYLEENKIGDYETVNRPWLLEPDIDDLIKILKYVYENTDELKIKFSDISSQIIKNWGWENTFYKIQERFNFLITGSDNTIYKQQEYEKEQNSIIDFEELINKISNEVNNNNIMACIYLIKSYIENKSIDLCTENKLLLYNLAGQLYLSINDYENAKCYFEKELNLNPSSSSACYGLGQIFFATEQYEAAKVMVEWAVKNDPSNNSAKEALQKINELLGYELTHSSLEGG